MTALVRKAVVTHFARTVLVRKGVVTHFARTVGEEG